ncbi:MAG: hypothetical protein KIS89_05165 [Dokdonella sp.]|nr:hypothetical protein [Dokdonella sp.]
MRPDHNNTLGSVKLLLHAFATSGQTLPSNARGRASTSHAPRGIELVDARPCADARSPGH